MNSRKPAALLAACVLGACAANASAATYIGEPIYIQDQPHEVTIHFMSATSEFRGILWLAASSSRELINPVDVPLFYNHDNTLNFEYELGEFAPGERLDFIYEVLTGAPNSFRTDTESGIKQFGWDWSAPNMIMVGVDDVSLPDGDGDYDDMVFEIRMTPVPAPAATAGLALLGILGFRRRR